MTHLRIGFDSQRGAAFSARLAEEAAESRRPERLTTPEEREAARFAAERSMTLTRSWTRGALAVACAEHDAKPGVHCFRSRLSGVQGICGARYAAGSARPVADPLVEPELIDLAQAARNAERDSRIREAARAAAQRRHPNRHPATHVRAEAAR